MKILAIPLPLQHCHKNPNHLSSCKWPGVHRRINRPEVWQQAYEDAASNKKVLVDRGWKEFQRSLAISEAAEDSNECGHRFGGPLSSVCRCCGIYKVGDLVKGPAIIKKTDEGGNYLLEAQLQTGGYVEFLSSEGPSIIITKEMMAKDDSPGAHLVLGGVQMQLSGTYYLDQKFQEGNQVHHMGEGKLAVSTRALHEGALIYLGPDGEICHPLNTQPEDTVDTAHA